MSEAPLSATFYKVGGALPQDVPSYVTRVSDDELFEALKAREFCYVLNSRQMGKSSLMVRTLTQLKAAGWAGVILDFSAKDSQSEQPDRWYAGILNQINRELKLLDRSTFRQWLKARDFIDPVERLGEFIETVLLPGTDRPIVLLIDEIDSTITLPFTDDFFALIRSWYNKRAENPDYQRLTLALFGVAMPSELIGDVKRTPFNIGKAIDLKGFDVEEALPLASGLAAKAERPAVALEEILYWTGGQPFLTQRVCQLVADSAFPITEGSEAELIEGLVQSRVIDQWESQDHQEHLKTIRQRLRDDEQKAGYLLELYQQIRQAGSLSAQNQPEERELQLAGLVVKRDSLLQVYNPIYAAVFDDLWIDAELKKLRPYSESFRAWIGSGKTDRSRLLRGVALEEAEQWAAERSPSAEDREFLSASRIQQQEEAIAAKQRDAELEREKAAREAAEATKQIEVEANLQAQRKIRRGNVVLGGTLAAALILGGFAISSGNQIRVANQKLEEAENLAEEAENLAQAAKKELTRIQQDKDKVTQDLTKARDEFAEAKKEVARSEADLKDAKTQRQVVEEELKQTEQQAKGQQALLAQLEQDLASADAATVQAKKAAAQAQQAEQEAQLKLRVVQREQDEIAALNETNKELSALIDDLHDMGKQEAADDVIQQIGLSFTEFTEDSYELKYVLLKSSTALAHLHLIPVLSDDGNNKETQKRIKEAQTLIDKSDWLIRNNPDIFSSKSGRAISFFTYAVQGSLWEEQGELFNANAFYKQAFGHPPALFNPEHVAESFARILNFSSSYSYDLEDNRFRALVKSALKKHYDFRAKQLILELEKALEEHRWQDADELTWQALFSSAHSRHWSVYVDTDSGFSYSNIICEHLDQIDTLWVDYSKGRFGFSIQKEKFINTGNTPGQHNKEDFIRFANSVGWNRIDGEIFEDIEELLSMEILDKQINWVYSGDMTSSEGVSGSELSAPHGHLPRGSESFLQQIRLWGMREGIVGMLPDSDHPLYFPAFGGQGGDIFSRIKSCNQ